jgi:hypothetical protein
MNPTVTTVLRKEDEKRIVPHFWGIGTHSIRILFLPAVSLIIGERG